MASYNPSRIKQQHDERLKQGLCVRCGMNKARAGRLTCFPCASKRHDSYERMKERRGIHQGVSGRHPMYLYSVETDTEHVFTGTAKEVARRFGVTEHTVHGDARCGRRLHGRYIIRRKPMEEATP